MTPQELIQALMHPDNQAQKVLIRKGSWHYGVEKISVDKIFGAVILEVFDGGEEE